MNVQNGGNKGLFQLFKAMGGLQKTAVIVAGVIIVGGGATAVTMAVKNAQSIPAEVSSVETSSATDLPALVSSGASSEETSSVKTSSEDVSSAEPSSVATSSAKSSSKTTASTKTSSKAQTASSGQPAVASTAPSPDAVAALPEGYQEKWADLYKQNKEFVGWIKFTGKLDYAVAQANNNSYYLDRSFKKERYVWGCPYMDSRVSPGQSTNTIIWSHSDPKTGAMFQSLKGLRKVDFYKQHPTVTFNDVYSDGTYKIIAYFVEDTQPENQTFRYQDFINQTDEATINTYITEAKKRSFINTTVDWAATDKFLTLSTCWDTNSKNWDRLVCVARKVRPGEDASVDTSGATQNTAQLLPADGIYNKAPY